MSTIDPQLAKSMLRVLSTMQANGARMPSHDVQRSAVNIAPDAISRQTMPVKLYHVRGSRAQAGTHGIRYMVALTMESLDPQADVLSSECSCPAGASGKMCKHAFRVLAEADRDGHRLRVTI